MPLVNNNFKAQVAELWGPQPESTISHLGTCHYLLTGGWGTRVDQQISKQKILGLLAICAIFFVAHYA